MTYSNRTSVYLIVFGGVAILLLGWFLFQRKTGGKSRAEMSRTITGPPYRFLTFSAAVTLIFAVGIALYFIHSVIGLDSAYWIVPVFGALGGLVGSLIRNVNHLTLVTFDSANFRIRLGFIGDVILGLGGSTVVAFLFENTLNFDPQKKSSYPLMISVCFIAGVFGQLLIEMAGEKVIAKEALQVAKSAQREADELKASAASAFLIASLYKFDKKQFDEALKAANRALELEPANVGAMIAKGRALKRLGRVEDALAIVNESLAWPDLAVEKEDLGVLLYNKACYSLLLRQEAADEPLELIEQAFDKKPSLKAIAVTDEDLRPIWGDSRFQQLTGQVGHPTES